MRVVKCGVVVVHMGAPFLGGHDRQYASGIIGQDAYQNHFEEPSRFLRCG